ncbi:hypothetical protein H6G96_28695 [Nostoc sp. FACHB-892]|uniref:hypothetical protein n=1 Tax=Nostoc sp. FACHB-892 TaxID=2692843 RepID=UPI001683850F|nr:hypothetical protein [Nostoc sp. FACHB-892]MBD2730191.1 hypothetical protein [Nostoc sp. FACHB-892]
MEIKSTTTFLFPLLIIYLYQIPLANASSYKESFKGHIRESLIKNSNYYEDLKVRKLAIQDEIGVNACLNAINNLVYDIATKEAGSPRIVSYYPGKAVLSLREIGTSFIKNKTKELAVSFEFEAIMNSDQYQLSYAQNIIKNCPGIGAVSYDKYATDWIEVFGITNKEGNVAQWNECDTEPMPTTIPWGVACNAVGLKP